VIPKNGKLFPDSGKNEFVLFIFSLVGCRKVLNFNYYFAFRMVWHSISYRLLLT